MSNLMEKDPFVVGWNPTFQHPATRSPCVAVFSINDSVLIDVLEPLVIVHPLDRCIRTDRACDVLCCDVVIKYMIDFCVVSRKRGGCAIAIQNSVGMIGNVNHLGIKSIDSRNGRQGMDLNSQIVGANMNIAVLGRNGHCEGSIVLVLLRSECGIGYTSIRQVDATNLNSIQIQDHAGIVVYCDLNCTIFVLYR